MADQQFCLRWNNHQSTLISVFDTLLENGTLVDCTLAAEGQYLKAHKVVLSACSPYLETLLSQHYEKHPIVILKDVKFTELKSMMDYMYRGEVNISQDQLGTFLKAAESLQIKGLSDNNEGDARDVGSTPKAPPPPRKATQPAPPTRPAIEPQRPDIAPESPAHRSRDGSISPSSRKRRRIRRNSQGDDSNLGDSHLDTSSCDLPSQAQSTPIVPNIPATVTSSITATPIKTPIVKPEQTELVNRIDTSNLNSLPPESGLLKEKIEPISEPLLEPKTEYLDEMNNEDSVEDLTLDDDDEMDGMDISNMSNMSNISRPGPSHGNDVSNQGFAPWHLGGNQPGADEFVLAAQDAVQGGHRDSQGINDGTVSTPTHDTGHEPIFVSTICPEDTMFFSELIPADVKNEEPKGLCLGKETDKFRPIRIPATSNNQSNLQTSNERSAFFSSRGRKRKLLFWSGDSFVKESHSEKNTKSVNVLNDMNSSTPANEARNIQARKNLLENKKRKYKYLYYPLKNINQYKKGQRTKLQANNTETTAGETKRNHNELLPSQLPGCFVCSSCNLSYRYLRGLRQHQQNTCRNQPFHCSVCPYKDQNKDNLMKHLESYHKISYKRHLKILETRNHRNS